MKFAKKTDIVIIAVIAAIGLLFWLVYSFVTDEKGTFAEIYYKSELVEKIELTSSGISSFSIPEVPEVTFHLYGDGSIAFIESDCPDKVCIRAGKLTNIGQFAACLPNEMYVKIVSGSDDNQDGPDIIIG